MERNELRPFRSKHPCSKKRFFATFLSRLERFCQLSSFIVVIVVIVAVTDVVFVVVVVVIVAVTVVVFVVVVVVGVRRRSVSRAPLIFLCFGAQGLSEFDDLLPSAIKLDAQNLQQSSISAGRIFFATAAVDQLLSNCFFFNVLKANLT